MASLADSTIQIAGIGHVYYAAPDTEAPDLFSYEFGDGTTLEASGWTWMGDTSSENLIEFATDGGDVSTLRTWDRTSVRSTREDVTNTVTINAVNLGDDTMKLAFPGSTYDDATKSFDLNMDGSVEKAILVVIVDGSLVSAYLFRRVTLAGSMPALSLDAFTEVAITGTLLSPASGKSKVRIFEPRYATGSASAKPTVTAVDPTSAAVGAIITITGTNFDGVRAVKIGGMTASFEKVSSTKITATVPSGATTGGVVVTNNVGDSTSAGFTVA
jgi:hypothetical protein